MNPLLNLYCDASGDATPGRGGFAVVTEYDVLLLGSEVGRTTSTRLEGLGVVAAMRLAATQLSNYKVDIYTDSMLWCHRHEHLEALQMNEWRLKSGKRVKEIDILETMWDYYNPGRVSVNWVKGHADTPGNLFADKAAKEARRITSSFTCMKEVA